MDITNFMPSQKNNPARAVPKAAALSLRGLTLAPVSGWENCAPPITVKRGTTRQIGRMELHEQGMVGISKMHCTLEAQASCLVLTATATFDVIVVHTFTSEDKSAETFRRLEKGESVSLEPGDRIYMAVDPRFVVARTPPSREHCAYAFKVVAATADEVAAAAAPAQAAGAASTTPSHTPATQDPAASAAASATTSGLNTTPRKRPASWPLPGSGSPKAPKQAAAQMTAKHDDRMVVDQHAHLASLTQPPNSTSTAATRSPSNPAQPTAGRSSGERVTGTAEPAGASLEGTPAPKTDRQQKRNSGSSRLLQTPSFAVGDHVHVNRRYAKDGGAGRIKAINETGELFTVKYTMGGTEKNIPRKALEVESDCDPVGSPHCSPEEAKQLSRRQRRRTSASSTEDSSPASSTSASKVPLRGRAQKPAPDTSKGKRKGLASSAVALKTETGVAASATAARTGPSPHSMKVTGESRKAGRSDVGRRVEVHWTAGESGWYGGTIRGFVSEQFRVEYDDGSEELEALGEGETFFPDPAEETQCQKPPKPSELVLVHDSQLKMPLVCRVVGARPDSGCRVRFIGWSRQNDITCWAKTSDKEPANAGAYLLDMTASNKQKAIRLNSQISKVDRAQGDIGRARLGSMVTADGLPDEERVWDVAIRQRSAKSDFQLMYLLADKKTWVPEEKLLSVDGRPLKGNVIDVGKVSRDAELDHAYHKNGYLRTVDPDCDAAGAGLAPTAVKDPLKPAAKVKSEVLFIAAYEEDWDDLTASEQDAARDLGWTSEQWDACEDPPARAQLWDDMGPEQRKAATVLGWDSTRWASAPTVSSLPLTDTCVAVDHSSESVHISASVRSTGIISLSVPLSHTSRRRSTSLNGNKAQHMALELDEAVGDDGDMANLPGFLHFIEHNAQLGSLPPKSVYEQLLAQLVDANACVGSPAPSVSSDRQDDDIQSHTFSQEMEDEELAEAQSRSSRRATQAQGALHATLHSLLRTVSRDVSDTVLVENRSAAAAPGWSAVSTRKGGDKTSTGPRQEDFQRFERSLSAVYSAVRTAAQPAKTAESAAVDACCGAALFLDYTTAVLADSSVKVGARVPETSMIWQLLYATNPSGSEGQIKQVLQLCIGIVQAASVAFAANDRLSPSMGDSGSDVDASRHHLWIAVTAAQRLLGLAVAVGATCHSSNMSYAEDDAIVSVTGGSSSLVIAPAQSSLLYQQYLGRLTTAPSKKLFFETLSHPALQMHMLDRVLCPGKQQHSGGGAAMWRRIFSWVHCPPDLRVSSTSCSQRQSKASSGAGQPARERIERLLILYSAAQKELQQAQHSESRHGGLTVVQPPEGFAEDLEVQQAHLITLLLTAVE